MEKIPISNLLVIVTTLNFTMLLLIVVLTPTVKIVTSQLADFLRRLHKVIFETLTEWAEDCPSVTKW